MKGKVIAICIYSAFAIALAIRFCNFYHKPFFDYFLMFYLVPICVLILIYIPRKHA